MKRTGRTVIEISASHLKMVRVSPVGEILFCHVSPLTGVSDGELSTRLEKIIRTQRFSRRERIVALIPRQDVLMKVLDLPSEDPNELRPMVELQIIQQLPYNLGEVAVDSLVLKKKDAGTSQVLTIAVPTEIFSRHWAIYEKAGLMPAQVTISSAGLAGFSRFLPPCADVRAVVDADTVMGEICILEGGRLLSCRQVSAGVPGQGVADLGRQIVLTLQGYDKEGISSVVRRVGLVSSRVSDDEILKKCPDLSGVDRAHLLERVPLARGSSWPLEVVSEEVSVASVVGAAFEVSLPFDLIPRIVQEGVSQKALLRQAIRSGIFFLLGAGALALSLSLPFWEGNLRVRDLENQLRSLKARAEEVQAGEDKIEALESLTSDRLVMANVLQELYGAVNPNIVLTGLEVDERRRIFLEGYGIGPQAVSVFQDALGRMSVCQEVNLVFINKRIIGRDEANQFRIVCQMKGGS
ncbi:MAG: pilus assembly protein PilM [Elusimicrobia bacterium]|nr:pilus assembly protein PilM [Elusimicrobiota bacterium]